MVLIVKVVIVFVLVKHFFNYTELVRLLVESGASIEKRDCHGQTALLLACKMNNMTIAQYLLSVGANVNAVDKVGKRPILL